MLWENEFMVLSNKSAGKYLAINLALRVGSAYRVMPLFSPLCFFPPEVSIAQL